MHNIIEYTLDNGSNYITCTNCIVTLQNGEEEDIANFKREHPEMVQLILFRQPLGDKANG
jgi:hypothetical protein